MCACVSTCADVCVCVCEWTCVQGGVEQVPHYQFPAMSLKRAVKSLQQIPYIHLCQSARHTLGVYTGGNTIYLMLHCPHVQSPPPHTGDSQCLTSISYSEQADRQASAGNGLHLGVNQHLNSRLNVIWKESTRGSRITPLKIFLFIYSRIDFCCSL